MRRLVAIIVAVAALTSAGTAAFAPDTSPRPLMRGGATTPSVPAEVASDPAMTEADEEAEPSAEPTVVAIAGSAYAPDRSWRPLVRPAELRAPAEQAPQADRATATRQTPGRVTLLGRRGRLCGTRGLEGEQLEAITGRIEGCGIDEPIRLREVDGIRLTQPATINCDTALALQEWLSETVVPTVGRRGGGVENIRVIASYSCRTRNSRPGARLSEHALGNAIDIAAIGLQNGSELSVLDGWNDRRDGDLLQEMHRGACGIFGTVLGPNSDRFHQDHFHLDVASYRRGSYCR